MIAIAALYRNSSEHVIVSGCHPYRNDITFFTKKISVTNSCLYRNSTEHTIVSGCHPYRNDITFFTKKML